MTSPALTGSGPIVLSDPRVAGIRVVEDGSPLVDLADLGLRVRAQSPAPPPGLGLTYAAGPAGVSPPGLDAPAQGEVALAGWHRLVRKTVAERLGEADALLPEGLHLLVVEGLRPLEVQRAIYRGYRARLAADRPELEAVDLDRLVSRFVAPPATAPHVSGAAVDLTLVADHGTALDLGTPIDATPEESDGACYFDAPQIAADARRLRTVLASALHRAGLVNYPTEWWHWSFGDRYWAHVTERPFAIHGPTAGAASAASAVDAEPERLSLSPRSRRGAG
jgi:D-alanyl-D-alanine dipeptidase